MKPISINGYKITSDGKLWSDKSNKFLKPSLDHKGYPFFHLSGKNVRLHRLVALAFIPNPDKLKYVNHKDYNKQNSHASNLEWCDASTNMLHSYKNGRKPNRGNAKFTANEVVDIRKSHGAGESLYSIAKRTNSSWSTINRIVKKEAWSDV